MNPATHLKTLVAVLLSALLVSAALSSAHALERVRWKLQISLAGTEEPVKRLVEQVKTISGGKIKLRFYEPNTLVPSSELHSAVGGGQVDAGFESSGTFARKIDI